MTAAAILKAARIVKTNIFSLYKKNKTCWGTINSSAYSKICPSTSFFAHQTCQ